MSAKNLLCGECACCGNVWVIAHLPMPMKQMGALSKRASCAVCGNTNNKEIAIAKTEAVQSLIDAGKLLPNGTVRGPRS